MVDDSILAGARVPWHSNQTSCSDGHGRRLLHASKRPSGVVWSRLDYVDIPNFTGRSRDERSEVVRTCV